MEELSNFRIFDIDVIVTMGLYNQGQNYVQIGISIYCTVAQNISEMEGGDRRCLRLSGYRCSMSDVINSDDVNGSFDA